MHRVSDDDTHYWYVMAAMDTKTASHAVRALKTTSPSKKYATLKGFLLAAFTPSKWQHAQCILAVHKLGDCHASQVADFLLRTLGDLDPDILLQYVLLRCLPPHLQHALTTSEADSLEKLADEAYKILDFQHPSLLTAFSTSRRLHLCSTMVFSVLPCHDEEPCSDQLEIHHLS